MTAGSNLRLLCTDLFLGKRLGKLFDSHVVSRMGEKEKCDMMRFNHFNFNVLNLDKSLEFYKNALGLEPVRTKEASDGSFKLVYLGDGASDFTLELTWLKERKEPYNLGECEFHLAFVTEDYEGAYQKHKEMGVVCFENPAMGIYFISDPDGYWIEIVPVR